MNLDLTSVSSELSHTWVTQRQLILSSALISIEANDKHQTGSSEPSNPWCLSQLTPPQPSPQLFFVFMPHCLWIGIWTPSLLCTVKAGTGLSGAEHELYSTRCQPFGTQQESCLDSQGSSHCSLPTFHLASWVLCGLTEVSSAWCKSPDVRGCLGSHNRTRHNLDQKGLALGPSWGAFLFPLFCTVWSAGH